MFHFFSLLIFVQRKSNHEVTNLMALSFYLQIVLSGLVFIVPIDLTNVWRYWIVTAHPLNRLFIFFMGICAGVLCIRIHQEDVYAFQSKVKDL